MVVENARLFSEARGKAALEERQRLARELHDSVSQALYGIALAGRRARSGQPSGRRHEGARPDPDPLGRRPARKPRPPRHKGLAASGKAGPPSRRCGITSGGGRTFAGEAAEGGLLAVLRAVRAYRRHWGVELSAAGRPKDTYALARITRENDLVRVRDL